MESLNDLVREYNNQLSKGRIQKAYREIMSFMSNLRTYLEEKNPDYTTGALYYGYMDMTYFAFTPSNLKSRKLKIAVVYLHEPNSFEVWLGGNNRKIQAEYIELFSNKGTGGYKLSRVSPGVDSIIESTLSEQPDFDNPGELMRQIESKVIECVERIVFILGEQLERLNLCTSS